MYADLRMIPHESALFSTGCKTTCLWGRPMSGHCEGVCASGAMVCPPFVALERPLGEHGMVRTHWFLCVFTWFFSETGTKSDRNSTTEKSDYCVDSKLHHLTRLHA